MKQKLLNGYRIVYVPDWPTAMTCNGYVGWVYEHRYVVENHLKRSLTTDEHVHHLNGDTLCNDIQNLIVLSNEDHTKLHNWLDGNQKLHKHCEYCNKRFLPPKQDTKYCSAKCFGLATRKVSRPSKEELSSLIWAYSFPKIGKMFGVAPNTVRKWCKAVNITNFPPRGYFIKK